MFLQQIDLTGELWTREQNGRQNVRPPPVPFSAPAMLAEKQLGFGISVQIRAELNRGLTLSGMADGLWV